MPRSKKRANDFVNHSREILIGSKYLFEAKRYAEILVALALSDLIDRVTINGDRSRLTSEDATFIWSKSETKSRGRHGSTVNSKLQRFATVKGKSNVVSKG